MDTPKTVLKERDYSTNTRQQVAKMSGVGTGTVAMLKFRPYLPCIEFFIFQ